MAITSFVADTATISTTEYSIVADAAYNSGTTFSTSDGVYQTFLDLADMTTGDELQIRVYEKVGAATTQRIVLQQNLVGPQSPPIWTHPALILMHGWDVTLDAIAGTIDVDWVIKKVA